MLTYKLVLILLITLFLFNKNSYTSDETEIFSYMMELPTEIKQTICCLLFQPTQSQEDANQLINDLINLSATCSTFHKLINNVLFFQNIINVWLKNEKDLEILLEALYLWPNQKIIAKALTQALKCNVTAFESFEELYKKAILEKNIEKIEFFLKLGANPNVNVNYCVAGFEVTNAAIIFAYTIGDQELMKILYEYGADINTVTEKYKHTIQLLIVNSL